MDEMQTTYHLDVHFRSRRNRCHPAGAFSAFEDVSSWTVAVTVQLGRAWVVGRVWKRI